MKLKRILIVGWGLVEPLNLLKQHAMVQTHTSENPHLFMPHRNLQCPSYCRVFSKMCLWPLDLCWVTRVLSSPLWMRWGGIINCLDSFVVYLVNVTMGRPWSSRRLHKAPWHCLETNCPMKATREVLSTSISVCCTKNSNPWLPCHILCISSYVGPLSWMVWVQISLT